MEPRRNSVIILYKDNKILLQHRSPDAPRNPDLWGCFGGGIEGEETPLEAVKRECFEELEYVLKAPRLIDTETRANGDVMHLFVEAYDGTPIVLHEGQGYGWFSLDEALQLPLSSGRRATLKRVRDQLF